MDWALSSKDIQITVVAEDQFEAFDELKDYGNHRFGLVVEAQPIGKSEGEAFVIRTSALMARWGRNVDSEAFSRAGESAGMGYISDVLPPEGESK